MSTIQELQEAKLLLEHNILTLVKDFEDEYGVSVTSINTTSCSRLATTNPKTILLDVEVKV